MPFHFKKSEPLAKAVQRVCTERVQVALAELRRSERPASVHNVRKEIKKLRATLRLVRDEAGSADFRRTMRPLRRAADGLAASRDARVMFRALENLVDDAAKKFPQLHQTLKKNWRRETRRLLQEKSIANTKRLLRKANKRMKQLNSGTAGSPVIAASLSQSYLRARELFAAAKLEPSPENLHEWRKQVKNFWYQSQLVCPKHASVAERYLSRLELLGEQLGEAHDLHLLENFLREHSVPAGREVVALNRWIVARQKRLLGAALKSGQNLFRQAPDRCPVLKLATRIRR